MKKWVITFSTNENNLFIFIEGVNKTGNLFLEFYYIKPTGNGYFLIFPNPEIVEVIFFITSTYSYILSKDEVQLIQNEIKTSISNIEKLMTILATYKLIYKEQDNSGGTRRVKKKYTFTFTLFSSR